MQIVKATLLLIGSGHDGLGARQVRFSLSNVLGAAVDNSPKAGEKLLGPGLQYGKSDLTKIDFISLSLALVLGTAGLPHVIMRFYTVPSSKEAWKSVEWAIWLIGGFYLLSLVLGYGAAALVGPWPSRRLRARPTRRAAARLRARREILLGLISAIAFATILAVVAGLTITASASFAHDVYAQVIKRGEVDADSEVRVARMTAVVIGIVAIIGGIFANGQNIAFLVALAFAVAASANLPTILYSLFLEAVQHPRRAVEPLRRPHLRGDADHLQPGRLRQTGHPRDGQVAVDAAGRGLPLVPARQPRHRVDPAGVLPRLARHRDEQRGAERGKVRGDGGAQPDRPRCREGGRPLTLRQVDQRCRVPEQGHGTVPCAAWARPDAVWARSARGVGAAGVSWRRLPGGGRVLAGA